MIVSDSSVVVQNVLVSAHVGIDLTKYFSHHVKVDS